MDSKKTQDRYKIIYGSAAPKLDYPAKTPTIKKTKKQSEEKKVKKEKPITSDSAEKEKRVEMNKKRFYAVDRRFMMILLAAAVIVATASFGYVRKSAQLSSMARQVKQLKNEKTELLNRQSTLQSEIDNSLDLDEIEEYAKENLNLVYPVESKILYYQKGADDYFRQFGNVSTDE